MIFATTPSQTVGPFFAIGLPWPDGPYVVPKDSPDVVRLVGTIYDGNGDPLPDFVLETWQADPEGRFADMWGHAGPSTFTGFRGFGRFAEEDGDGSYELWTLKPGPVPGPGQSTQAPHIDVTLMARGMLHQCVTRVYFADEETANSSDPVLATVPRERRPTLLAQPVDGGYRFDIRLQGRGETVFFLL